MSKIDSILTAWQMNCQAPTYEELLEVRAEQQELLNRLPANRKPEELPAFLKEQAA